MRSTLLPLLHEQLGRTDTPFRWGVSLAANRGERPRRPCHSKPSVGPLVGDDAGDRSITIRHDELGPALYGTQVLREMILELGYLHGLHGYIEPHLAMSVNDDKRVGGR